MTKIDSIKIMNEKAPVTKKEYKYLITLFKGQSLAMKEEVDSGKLIMFRLKISILGLVNEYSEIPTQYQELKDLVSNTDIDVEIIVKFLEKKMDHKAVIKFMSSLVEVYKIAEVDEKIGELEMDEDQFKEFTSMLKYLSFDIKQNNEVF